MSLTTSKKSIFITTLLGAIFFFGGAGVVSAEGWTFTYTTKASSSVVNTYVPSFASEPACKTQRDAYAADTTTYSNVYLCKGIDATVTATAPITSTNPPKPSGGYSYFNDSTGAWSQVFSKPEDCQASEKKTGKQVTSCSLSQGTGISSGGVVAGTEKKYDGPIELENFKCGGSLTGLELDGCLPIGVYYLIYKPASIVLMGGGLLFDKMLDLSIKKEFVNRPFVNSSWEVVRDFSNMLFIFILLYTGISTMLGAKDWRSVVLKVIIIALLINFSLFFTKVVIDAGNILATGVYSSINTGTLSLSESIVKNFEPQAFLNMAGKVDALDAIVIFLIAGAINAYAGYIFFKAALLFLGRLIAFWFLMIVSPFAFISTALPKGNVFGDWWNTLLNQSFVAPVYLFLLYLIMQVINVKDGILGDMPTGKEGDSWLFSKLLTPIIVAALIMFAMQQALKMAEKMAGDFGKMGSEVVGKVMGAGAMVATGGASLAGMAGRTMIGGRAARELQSGAKSESELTAMSEGERTKYEARRATLVKRTQSSYDIRNIGDKDSLLSKTISGKVFKKDYGAGGVEKAEKDRIQKELKTSESIKMSVFEEQGLRGNPGAVSAAVASNLASTKELSSIATEELNTQKDLLKIAEKAAEESNTGKTLKETAAAYEEARARAERDKGSVYEAESLAAAVKLKTDLDVAQKLHTESPAFTAIKISKVAVKKSEAKVQAANKKMEEAQTTSEMKDDDPEKATWVIKKENDRRTKVYADKLGKDGRHVTASKVRKGETSGKSVEGTLKELLKKEKEATEEKDKKSSDSEKKPKAEGEAKH